MNNELSIESQRLITETLTRFPEIESAILFGSRAKGNNGKGSDVDIAITGGKITSALVVRLSALLNQELPLPYYFDIVHYESITNAELKRHIDRVGKPIGNNL